MCWIISRFIVALFAVILLPFPVFAEKITISAAASLKFGMDEIVAKFRKIHPKDTIEVIYGSSGKLQAQIKQGAPYDLFFAADMDFPRALVKSGDAASEVKAFALGRIVLWSATQDAKKMLLTSLTDAKIKRIAIANPKVAPYGARAEEALRADGVLEKVRDKIVYGHDIAQTSQFVQTGNADVGIIALSLAVNQELVSKGGYFLIPAELHQPLEHGFVVTKRAEKNVLAKSFAEYVVTDAVGEIFNRHGFSSPGETKVKVK